MFLPQPEIGAVVSVWVEARAASGATVRPSVKGPQPAPSHPPQPDGWRRDAPARPAGPSREVRSAVGPRSRTNFTVGTAAAARHRRLRRRRAGAAGAYGAASGHLARPEYRLAPPALESACPRPRLRPSSAPSRVAPPRPASRMLPIGMNSLLRVTGPQVRRHEHFTGVLLNHTHASNLNLQFTIFNFQFSVWHPPPVARRGSHI